MISLAHELFMSEHYPVTLMDSQVKQVSAHSPWTRQNYITIWRVTIFGIQLVSRINVNKYMYNNPTKRVAYICIRHLSFNGDIFHTLRMSN